MFGAFVKFVFGGNDDRKLSDFTIDEKSPVSQEVLAELVADMQYEAGNFDVEANTVRFIEVPIQGVFSYDGLRYQKIGRFKARCLTPGTNGVAPTSEFPTSRKVVYSRANAERPNKKATAKVFGKQKRL